MVENKNLPCLSPGAAHAIFVYYTDRSCLGWSDLSYCIRSESSTVHRAGNCDTFHNALAQKVRKFSLKLLLLSDVIFSLWLGRLASHVWHVWIILNIPIYPVKSGNPLSHIKKCHTSLKLEIYSKF